MARLCQQLLVLILLVLVPGLSSRPCAILQTLSGQNCHKDVATGAARGGHAAAGVEVAAGPAVSTSHDPDCHCDAPRPTSEPVKASVLPAAVFTAEILAVLPPAIAPPPGAVRTTAGKPPPDPQRKAPLLI
jgi:hypothetical protein